VVINLPGTPFEAVVLPFLARFIVRRLIIVSYHCDVQLPDSRFNNMVNEIVFFTNVLAGKLVDRVVAYTNDYAEHSHFLSKFPHKREVIPPPVVMPEPDTTDTDMFRRLHASNSEYLIGFAARFAAEKGIEYMIDALQHLIKETSNIKVLFAGECQNIIGEENYWTKMQPKLEQVSDNWVFLGELDPSQMAAFYGGCDVTVLPSTNSTESFGFVQVESMLCGTPVVASNLPGVRIPVQTTEMGRIVPSHDSRALAEAVLEVIQHREKYIKPREEIERHFSLEKTLHAYEGLFEKLKAEINIAPNN
jgi:glycosyltransferase involved in cell wall biosynthesis